MNEPSKNPFEPFFEEVRWIVREELARASGNGHTDLLTAEHLGATLQVNKATVYQ